jgi:hypothetical protein
MHLLRRRREAGLSLTVGDVALIAAGIGLASPLIAYWTTARLDRALDALATIRGVHRDDRRIWPYGQERFSSRERAI